MSTCQDVPLGAAVKWSEESIYLKDFVRVYQLPQLARVSKGQYSCIGVPGIITDVNLAQNIFLHSSYKMVKVLAQCIKIKDSSRKSHVSVVGPKVSIPASYKGWFEVLSEEGKAVRPLESVVELVAKSPDSFLVRDSVKVFLGNPEGEMTPDRSRIVQSGEVLSLAGVVTASRDKRRSQQFLRCYDTRGDSLFFAFDAKGVFSPIAKEENISGVHTIKDVLGKFRLPLTVRLVSGAMPQSSPSSGGGKLGGGGGGAAFAREIRLLSSYEEECILAHPLDKDATNNNNRIVTLPVTACLKLSPAKNQAELDQNRNLMRFRDKCAKLLPEIMENMQVCEESYGKEMKVRPRPKPEPARGRPGCPPAVDPTAQPETEEDIVYKEIDDIYGMVVRGIVPLRAYTEMKHEEAREKSIDAYQKTPPRLTAASSPKNELTTSLAGDDKPPLPPRNGVASPRKISAPSRAGDNLNHLVYSNRVPNENSAKLSNSNLKYVAESPRIGGGLPPPADPYFEPLGVQPIYKKEKVPNASNRLLNLIHNAPKHPKLNGAHKPTGVVVGGGYIGRTSASSTPNKRHSTAGVIPLAHSRSQPVLIDVRTPQQRVQEKKRHSFIDSNGMHTSSSSGSDGMKYNSAQDLHEHNYEEKVLRQEKIKAADQRLKRLSNFFL
ncbi:PREDICTED: uncharacterized protein LOC106808293 [Priapulus caudatus]|uniref:Uncharacterized protein LOC106808293 n=1 Tax=Priapulus caudatus TaxID=37621 RepID=A0ABM1E2L3_PRICU|nr:PREDICTED: uncharacterized protein LOC106808293 [Priapulus caudatus]